MLVSTLAFSFVASALFAVAQLGEDLDVEYPYDLSSASQVPFHADFGHPGEPPGSIPGPKSIYETLMDSPQFSNVTKLLSFDKELVNLLNDSSDAGLTFFAVPDWALRRRPKKRHTGNDSAFSLPNMPVGTGMYDLPDIADKLQALEELPSNSSDDKDKDKKRKFLLKLLHTILSYHILPGGFSEEQLRLNTTFATKLVLSDGSLDGQPLRIRVGTHLVTERPSLNLYSYVVGPETLATNGVIHAVSYPLLPPPSIFQSSFLFPKAFSTFTSALQRVGLTDAVDRHLIPGKDGKKRSHAGATTLTALVPVNRAFDALPQKLRLFLFSPFGERVLKKLLQYHIIPDLCLHTDYFYNATSKGDIISDETNMSVLEGVSMDDLTNLPSFALSEALDIPQSVPHYGEPTFRTEMWSRPGDWQAEPMQLFPTAPLPVYPSPVPGCSSACAPAPSWPAAEHRRPIPMPEIHPSRMCRHSMDHSLPPMRPVRVLESQRTIRRSPPSCLGRDLPKPPKPELIASRNLTVPTLLGTNHTVNVFAAKFKVSIPFPIPGPHPPTVKFFSGIWVNGQRVPLADLVGRNGAMHVTKRLISPRHRHRHHRLFSMRRPDGLGYSFDESADNDWEEWEEWLPQWAADN